MNTKTFAEDSESRVAQSASCAIIAAADRVVEDSGVLRNDYLAGIAEGTMSLESFRSSQEQFYFAVYHFPRPMANLVARLPDPVSRLELLRNLVEEHGEFDRDEFHEVTFRRFLEMIGARSSPRVECKRSPVIAAFNASLDGICATGDLDAAVACVGVIEYAFAEISAAIAAGAVARGWVAEERLVHYGLHAEIDKRHARELFAIVEGRWSDAEGRAAIEAGLELGAYIFERLYRDLATLS